MVNIEIKYKLLNFFTKKLIIKKEKKENIYISGMTGSGVNDFMLDFVEQNFKEFNAVLQCGILNLLKLNNILTEKSNEDFKLFSFMEMKDSDLMDNKLALFDKKIIKEFPSTKILSFSYYDDKKINLLTNKFLENLPLNKKEELPILGTPKPFQINCLWNNNFYDYNFR